MYLDEIAEIAREDIDGLLRAEENYGDSWKKRGGVGAFMMLARKWDRLENRVSQPTGQYSDNASWGQWDIFDHLIHDDREEGLLDDIRDLRRYLILVEAEMRARAKDNKGESYTADVSPESRVATPRPEFSTDVERGDKGCS